MRCLLVLLRDLGLTLRAFLGEFVRLALVGLCLLLRNGILLGLLLAGRRALARLGDGRLLLLLRRVHVELRLFLAGLLAASQ